MEAIIWINHAPRISFLQGKQFLLQFEQMITLNFKLIKAIKCIKFKVMVSRNTSISFGVSLGSSSLLSLDSSESICFEYWIWCNLNVLLRWNSYHIWWNVNKLLSDSNMSLSYQNSCMMNWICELSLANKSLESSLHKLVKSQS